MWLKHRHKWVTTHTNKWMIATRQICKGCGLVRKADTRLSSDPLTYCWKYSDGKISKPYNLGEGLDD